jgi:carbamoyltransferase
MRVLGLSGHFQGAAAALVVDGTLVAAAEEERFSRRRHDASLPLRAADFCLRQGGLAGPDLDAVVWYEKPLLKFERILLTTLRTFPRSAGSFRRAMLSVVGDKLWVRSRLAHALGVPPKRILFSTHHASHAASAFYCSPFEEAAILCVDGAGEWATTSTWVGSADGLRPLAELHFPSSLGLLYAAVSAFLGFAPSGGEHKVTALAALGTPRFRAEMDRVVRRQADGSFDLDMTLLCFDRSPDRGWTPRFEALFGPPRAADAPCEPRHHDIAASLQQCVEDILLDLARRLHAETQRRHLCLAGSVALNAAAVGRLLAEGPFDDVFVPPAAGDAGAALGAALLVAPQRRPLAHAAWGADLDHAAVRAFLEDGGIRFEEHADERIADEVARRLLDGQVIGWMQGRFEFGPRALGQRSILCDPRRAEARDRVNARVKYREAFRPCAPSVLAGAAATLFHLPGANGAAGPARGAWTRRFGTATLRARDDRIPGAVHVDGRARVAEVAPDQQPLFARLLATFGAGAGAPCLINTSFNLSGEPMVASAADGWATFLRTSMDALAIGPFLVTR